RAVYVGKRVIRDQLEVDRRISDEVDGGALQLAANDLLKRKARSVRQRHGLRWLIRRGLNHRLSVFATKLLVPFRDASVCRQRPALACGVGQTQLQRDAPRDTGEVVSVEGYRDGRPGQRRHEG